MIFLKNIILTQFRNYTLQSFSFTERIIGICGPNGSGKTNLLDAIYYLCFTRSYFSRPDNQSVHHGLPGFRIEGQVKEDAQTLQLVCILRENNRKEFSLNEKDYKRFSEHIGRFSCVMIVPDDAELITTGSEGRRKFIDTLLAQLNPDYLKYLIDYNKILQQRNSLLKAAGEHNRTDDALLDILDEQLSGKGQHIFNWRMEFLKDFLPLVKQQYQAIAEKNDAIEIDYESQLCNVSFKKLLKENRQRDMYLQRTGCGIHKDDLEIAMNGGLLKTMASQGQRKSILFALKLAEFITLKQNKGFPPVLLLDDVFEKLDARRMHNLLHKVCVQENGQIFITDTHKERLQKALKDLSVNFQLIELQQS